MRGFFHTVKSEAVSDGRTEAVCAVLVVAAVSPFGRACQVYADFFFMQVRVGHVDGDFFRRAPGRANAVDLAVARRDTHRAVYVVGWRLVDGETAAQGPLFVDFVGRADGVGPGVVPVLLFNNGADRAGSAAQLHRHALVVDGDVLQTAPASPGTACVQGPVLVQFVGHREVHGLRQFDVQRRVVLVAVERTEA